MKWCALLMVLSLPPVTICPPAKAQPTVRRSIVEALRTQLTKLELDRLAAVQQYGSHSVQVRSLDGQIAAIKARLRQETRSRAKTNPAHPSFRARHPHFQLLSH